MEESVSTIEFILNLFSEVYFNALFRDTALFAYLFVGNSLPRLSLIAILKNTCARAGKTREFS